MSLHNGITFDQRNLHVMCKHCGVKLSYHNITTTMRNHMKSKHQTGRIRKDSCPSLHSWQLSAAVPLSEPRRWLVWWQNDLETYALWKETGLKTENRKCCKKLRLPHHYLFVPATSVSVGRFFCSAAGLIVIRRETLLDVKHCFSPVLPSPQFFTELGCINSIAAGWRDPNI